MRVGRKWRLQMAVGPVKKCSQDADLLVTELSEPQIQSFQTKHWVLFNRQFDCATAV